MNLSFFDCDCVIGRRHKLQPGSFWETDKLIAEMDRLGVTKALVYHAEALEEHPTLGNDTLMNEIKNQPRLEPVWIVLPNHTGEFYEPIELIKNMKQHDVRFVRMFPAPNNHNFAFTPWGCGELLAALQQAGINLIIGLDQTNWEAIRTVALAYPKLKMIVANIAYRDDRYLYPILKECKNIIVETLAYKTTGGIDEVARRFGVERLVYGSGMPIFSGAAATTMIRYLSLSDEDKSRIAGGNLEALRKGANHNEYHL